MRATVRDRREPTGRLTRVDVYAPALMKAAGTANARVTPDEVTIATQPYNGIRLMSCEYGFAYWRDHRSPSISGLTAQLRPEFRRQPWVSIRTPRLTRENTLMGRALIAQPAPSRLRKPG